MAVETIPWNIQDQIKTDERQLGRLVADFEDSDPALITAAIGDIARARAMSKVAEEAGVTHERLDKALSATGDPRSRTLMGVVKSLGRDLVPRRRAT